jgi:hypothetical protein
MKASAHRSPSARLREARRRNAEAFLREVIFPRLDNGELEQLTTEELEHELRCRWEAFRGEHSGQGDDFDLAHVEGLVFVYTQVDNQLSLQETGQPLPDIQRYQKAWRLLATVEVDRICYGWNP